MNGDVALGFNASSAVTVNAPATFLGNTITMSRAGAAASSAPQFVLQRQQTTSAAVSNGFDLGAVLFQAWDGSAYHTSAKV